MRIKHASQLNAFTKVQLTSEQKSGLDSILRDCFDDLEKDNGDNCQICNQSVGGISSNSFACKREHALYHVDFMLYKCMEDGCQFESGTIRSVKKHGASMHKTETALKFSKIELTAEQESEIEDIVIKCFPNLDRDGTAT